MRTETDSLGSLSLPDDAYYGIQTKRAVDNFPVSGRSLGEYPRLVWSIAAIKKAAALAHNESGLLEPTVAEAISKAAEEVMTGVMNGSMCDQFPVDMLQGGGGTSMNMNVNEVIANRANELITGKKGYDKVHPLDHVNKGQSTNDVIPSAVKLTLYFLLKDVCAVLGMLETETERKAEEFKDVVKLSRTCLQDALPVTLGQEFSGFHSFLRRQREAILLQVHSCTRIPLGATAVGTRVGATPGSGKRMYAILSDIIGAEIKPVPNFFDALQNSDQLLNISAALKTLAAGLSKMASDFRLLASGPRGGLCEIELPAVQPGSSIMPGKVNPVIPEMINQVCYRICGNDAAVTMAVEGGELDINVWAPLIASCLFESCSLLVRSIPVFAEKCVRGVAAREETCRRHAESSLSLATVIAQLFDYETAAKTAKYAAEHNLTVNEAAVALQLLSADEAKRLLDPLRLARGLPVD